MTKQTILIIVLVGLLGFGCSMPTDPGSRVEAPGNVCLAAHNPDAVLIIKVDGNVGLGSKVTVL